MIVVSDTSPLCYLILIDEVDLLPKLFRHVLLTQAVLDELRHEDAPDAVRAWADHPPSWISVRDYPAPYPTPTARLHVGELSTISLAESLQAELILLDDKAARRAAAERGFRVTGTLGVLAEASAQGLVDLTGAMERLRATNFRYAPGMLKAMLDRYCRK